MRPHVAEPAGSEVREQIRAILEGEEVQRWVSNFRELRSKPCQNERTPLRPLSAQHQGKAYPSQKARQLIPDYVADMKEHLSLIHI